MRTGLIAGSIAAMVATLVSLPLRSPSDAILNSATVAVGVLTVGLVAGMAWNSGVLTCQTRTASCSESWPPWRSTSGNRLRSAPVGR